MGTVSALVFGALSDKFNRSAIYARRDKICTLNLFYRPLLLAIATSVASICGMLMGAAKEYWHLVILRMITSSG